MTTEIDIYRVAKIVMEKHGDRALLEAMARIEEFRSSGDDEGQRIWEKVADTIEWLLAPAKLTRETQH